MRIRHGYATDHRYRRQLCFRSRIARTAESQRVSFADAYRLSRMPQAQRTLDAAMATTLDAATADMKQSHIAVVSSDSEDDGTTPGSSAFAGTLKTGLYPLLLVMPVCTFLVVSTFNDNEIRRRLYSSPARLVSLEAQQMLTCGTFGLLVCAAYTAVTFLLMRWPECPLPA